MLPVREKFHLPAGVVYLDGNSLGPLPRSVPDRVQKLLSEEWGEHLIRAWNVDGWMAQPVTVANRIGRLIGAPKGTVVMGDTLSIKVFQALSAALAMRPNRRVILSDSGNFPSDLYMAQGLVRHLGHGHELRVVDPEYVMDAIGEDVAVVMVTQVDYRTGRMHDLSAMTRRAHEAGAVMLWDLAHSAGAVEVDVTAAGCEFAVGCTYKYLNGGPGAPAFIYVRPDLATDAEVALSGWLGHDAPFAFEPDYRPARDIERMRVGTPPIIQIAALDAALDIWDGIDIAEVRAASLRLSELFISEIEARCPELSLVSPREGHMRGSQVSFGCDDGYSAMQALIDHGVIGDFRAPNIMRFGFTPLYLDETDVLRAADVMEEVFSKRLWDRPEYRRRNRVT